MHGAVAVKQVLSNFEGYNFRISEENFQVVIWVKLDTENVLRLSTGKCNYNWSQNILAIYCTFRASLIHHK